MEIACDFRGSDDLGALEKRLTFGRDGAVAVTQSERGLDRTRQGESVTIRWPVALGGGSVELVPVSEPGGG